MRFINGIVISVLALQFFSAIVVAVEIHNRDIQLQMWGTAIQDSLMKESINSLVIDARTNKTDPKRIVEVKQFYLNTQEINDILKPAAVILKEGDFDLITHHNLAETIVSFKFELKQICTTTAGKFIISSTGGPNFYIGCISSNEMYDERIELVRIKSDKLYKALRPYFSREIIDEKQ